MQVIVLRRAIARRVAVHAAGIRKDLSYLGKQRAGAGVLVGDTLERCRVRSSFVVCAWGMSLVQDSESSDSIAQMVLQDRREDGLDRMPTQSESLTFAQSGPCA
jgi:hypothetical protein